MSLDIDISTTNQKALALVNADSTFASTNGFASVSSGGIGLYDFVFSTPCQDANYVVLATIENSLNDANHTIQNRTANGFRVRVQIGDNGSLDDTLANIAFNVVVYDPNVSINVVAGKIVDTSFLTAGTVTGDANASNNTLTLTTSRIDTGWTFAINQATYTGTPDKVRIDAMFYYSAPQSNTLTRITPHIQLMKGNTVIAEQASYQRHATGNNKSGDSFAFTDPNPLANPVYWFRSQQGGDQDDILLIDRSSFSFDAIVKETV